LQATVGRRRGRDVGEANKDGKILAGSLTNTPSVKGLEHAWFIRGFGHRQGEREKL